MEKIAVFDLQSGGLVAARGGRRATYLPIAQAYDLPEESPSHWATIISTQLGISRFYIADLDAIENIGNPGGLSLTAELLEAGYEIWLDTGRPGIEKWGIEKWEIEKRNIGRSSLDAVRDVMPLLNYGRFHLIVPTENAGIVSAAQAIKSCPAVLRKRLTLSLDVFGAFDSRCWYKTDQSIDPEQVVRTLTELAELGLEQVILLNLSDVGSGLNSTWDLFQRFQEAVPQLTWITGGGISTDEDLQRLDRIGCDAVLLGSWLWQQLEQSYFAGQGDQ